MMQCKTKHPIIFWIMPNVHRNVLIKFTFIFCVLWIYVVLFISTKYNTLLRITEADQNVIGAAELTTKCKQSTKCVEQDDINKPTTKSLKRKGRKRSTWNPKYSNSSTGYNGEGEDIDVDKLSPEEKQKYDDGWKRNAFNQYASDLIPVNRYTGDHRHQLCKEIEYSYDLPEASVVIIFHNEAWSVLWRTVYSILNTSPPHLLRKIYLVDDASTQDHLHDALEKEVSKFSNICLLRTGKRVGLIQARLLGFSKVTTKVAIFLDSHCECTEGWLEPLLQKIKENESTVAVPLADAISAQTFGFNPVNIERMHMGGFDFDLNFNWRPIPESEQERRTSIIDSVRTPTFLGCCFAISVDFFKHLGTYDPGYQIWGAENLELSFKTWMCGGSVEIIPCSHVGHMFRNAMPYSWGDNGMQILIRNSLRLAKVWMDDYRKLYYDRIFYNIDFDLGDISDRLSLRKSLKCQSFDWYLKNVYPDLFLPYNSKATGQIRNERTGLCIESPVMGFMMNREVSLKPCSVYAFNQHWTLTEDDTIRRDEGCLGYQRPNRLVIKPCTPVTPQIIWTYSQDKHINNYYSQGCFEVSPDRNSVHINDCNTDNTQIWAWQRRKLLRQ